MEPRLADVAEAVRSVIATYTHALDDGRTDDVVATFWPDASCDLGDMGVHRGHDELRAAYAQWVPRRPQRHLVVNTTLTEWSPTRAVAVSDVVFLLGPQWAVQVVGRYTDTLRCEDGEWRFEARQARFTS